MKHGNIFNRYGKNVIIMFYFTKNTNTFFKKMSKYYIFKDHRKLWLSLLVAGSICILILFYFIFSFNKVSIPSQSSVSMKIYTDSLNYFNINVPNNWITQQEKGENTTGLNTPHPVSQQIEISQLYIPARGGITIQVYEGKPTCPLGNKLTTSLSGFPASYDAILETWTIPTTKATLTITVSYPGSILSKHNPMQNRTTPPPPSIIEQNKNNVMSILKTLKLTNLKPFSCL